MLHFPSRVSEIVNMWKASLVEQDHSKIADSIADPEKYNTFMNGHTFCKNFSKILLIFKNIQLLIIFRSHQISFRIPE